VLDEEEGDGPCAAVGQYVTLHIAGVPVTNVDLSAPLVVFGMFRYESKLSVVHLNIKRHPLFKEPFAAKEEVEVHIGPRRFVCRPIFSECTFNADKFKFERFLHESRNVIASIYAPVTFPPAPVLMYKRTQTSEGVSELTLVATGSLHSVNPDRVILKKIVLTGNPFRVHKKRAIVRDMFYFIDDIRWFKPVELRTKLGRVGHIIEPLGTHGYMKCLFDGTVTQADTVMMPLYKRIYPVTWEGLSTPKLL